MIARLFSCSSSALSSLPCFLYTFAMLLYDARHVRVMLAVHLDPDREALLVQLQRLVQLALLAVHARDVVVRCRHVRVMLAVHLDPDREALLVQLQRLVQLALLRCTRSRCCCTMSPRPGDARRAPGP